MSFLRTRQRSGSSKAKPSSADPDFLRHLVLSEPLHVAPATAVVADHDGVSASPTAAIVRSKPASNAWNAHLAQLLHSIYLVTLTEKAQLGAMYNRNGEAAATPPSASASTAPTASHSITVDERWLDAVTRYCHVTCTLDDVARVAMVFPDWLQVRWTMEVANYRASPNFLDTLADDAGAPLLTSTVHANSTHVSGQAEQSSGGRLVARVYLRQSRVVSLEEASTCLRSALGKMECADAQRAWKAAVNHHTAYAAYLTSAQPTRAPDNAGESRDAADDPSLISSAAENSGNTSRRNDTDQHHDHDQSTLSCSSALSTEADVADEALYATLSAELRASLSAPKLQALLRQMRRDAAHVEEAEQHRIAQRQLQERLLHAYEHVRALFGPKDTRGRSALTLIRAMQEESRFEDTLDIQALLSTLLKIPAAGLSATMLREGRVVAEPAPSQPVKGVSTRGKRKRAEAEAQEGTPLVLRVMEPTLEPVADLRTLTDEQLELVLVKLDRAKGSVRGVLEATAQRQL